MLDVSVLKEEIAKDLDGPFSKEELSSAIKSMQNR